MVSLMFVYLYLFFKFFFIFLFFSFTTVSVRFISQLVCVSVIVRMRLPVMVQLPRIILLSDNSQFME